MQKKYIALVLVVVILTAGFLFLFLPSLQPSNISVQFYDAEGNKVGKPLSIVPLNPIFIEGQEVTSFSVTVNWQTSDPSANAIDWALNLEVYYISVDSVPPETKTVWDELLWSAGSSSFDNGAGSRESGLYPIDACALVPEDTGFYMLFTGTYRFLNKWSTPDPEPIILFAGDFIPLSISGYHGAYEYLAWVNM